MPRIKGPVYKSKPKPVYKRAAKKPMPVYKSKPVPKRRRPI